MIDFMVNRSIHGPASWVLHNSYVFEMSVHKGLQWHVYNATVPKHRRKAHSNNAFIRVDIRIGPCNRRILCFLPLK